MEQYLKKYLFRNDAHTYAVLDGASVPNLPIRMHETEAVNACLMTGELPDDLVYAAPYLVYLEPGDAFTEWVLAECWGKHWGIFAQSPVSFTGIRKKLRSLLIVNREDGNPKIFRFYDPRVISPFLMTCATDELELIFEDVSYFFAENTETNELLRFNLKKNKLVETKLRMQEEPETVGVRK
ncbi:MAG TPA: DUF4123 domain-containing protein [Pyrinomonadaceae bacterium]|nr:DUF4123 domain-containing protein [Pyrinomonadaceae bacterium]